MLTDEELRAPEYLRDWSHAGDISNSFNVTKSFSEIIPPNNEPRWFFPMFDFILENDSRKTYKKPIMKIRDKIRSLGWQRVFVDKFSTDPNPEFHPRFQDDTIVPAKTPAWMQVFKHVVHHEDYNNAIKTVNAIYSNFRSFSTWFLTTQNVLPG